MHHREETLILLVRKKMKTYLDSLLTSAPVKGVIGYHSYYIRDNINIEGSFPRNFYRYFKILILSDSMIYYIFFHFKK